MDDAQIERPVGRGNILQRGAAYVREPLVDVRRLSFVRRAPDHDRHGVDQLLKLPFAPPQRFVGVYLIVDVVTEPVPLGDGSVWIPHWLCTARHPAIDAIGTAQAISRCETLACGQAIADDLSERCRIIRMDRGL